MAVYVDVVVETWGRKKRSDPSSTTGDLLDGYDRVAGLPNWIVAALERPALPTALPGYKYGPDASVNCMQSAVERHQLH